MFEKIFDLVKSNLKNPKLYISLLAILLVGLVLFPYIDANFFYYERVDHRIEILKKVSEINIEEIQDNEILYQEYNRILSEIEKQSAGSFGTIFIKESNIIVNVIKFLTGGLIPWLLAILCIFLKTFNKTSEKVLGVIFCIILGVIIGFVAKIMPTIISPWVNYVGVPLLIIIFVALLCTGGKEKDNKK